MHRPNNKDESWLSVHIMSFGFDSFHLGVDKPIIYRVDHTAKYVYAWGIEHTNLPETYFEWALFVMCFSLNVLFLEYAIFGLCSFWNVPYFECALFGMCPFWNVLFWNVAFLECALFGMCPFRNVLFLEYAFFRTYFFWNVLYLIDLVAEFYCSIWNLL